MIDWIINHFFAIIICTVCLIWIYRHRGRKGLPPSERREIASKAKVELAILADYLNTVINAQTFETVWAVRNILFERYNNVETTGYDDILESYKVANTNIESTKHALIKYIAKLQRHYFVDSKL